MPRGVEAMSCQRILIAIALLMQPALSFGEGGHKTFDLAEFQFEDGTTVPKTFLTYVTHGELNRSKSNLVLLPSWYSGDHHGYDYLIGRNKALDPKKYFIVATDMFANGLSSSPSNTPPPYDGPRFPQVSIRDNVYAANRLLTEEFGVEHIKAVIGFSMGAQQALQWAVSFPESVDFVVAYCGNAKEYPFGIVRLEGAKSALMADSAWMDGDYGKQPPEKGLRALARHWAAWGVSQEWWRRETFRTTGASSIEESLRAGETYWLSRDANDLLWQANAWQNHNVAETPGYGGDFEAALKSINARVLLMPSETDLYFPVEDALYEQKLIPGAKIERIPSIWGHDVVSDPAAIDFLNSKILAFLNNAQ